MPLENFIKRRLRSESLSSWLGDSGVDEGEEGEGEEGEGEEGEAVEGVGE